MLCLFLDSSSDYSELKDKSEVVYVDDFATISNFTSQVYDIIVFASGNFVEILGDLAAAIGPDTKLFKPKDLEVPLERTFKTFYDAASFLDELSSTKVLMDQGINFDEKLDLNNTQNMKLQGAIESVITTKAEEANAPIEEQNEGLNISFPDNDESEELTSVSLQMPDEEPENIEEAPDEIPLEAEEVPEEMSLAAEGEIDEQTNIALDDNELDLETGDIENIDLAAEDDIAELNELSVDDAADVIEMSDEEISSPLDDQEMSFSDNSDQEESVEEISENLKEDLNDDHNEVDDLDTNIDMELSPEESSDEGLGDLEDVNDIDDDLGGLDDLGDIDDLGTMSMSDDLYDDLTDMTDFNESTGETVVGSLDELSAGADDLDDDFLEATVVQDVSSFSGGQSADEADYEDDEEKTMIETRIPDSFEKPKVDVANFSKSVDQITNSLISSLDSNELLSLKVTLGELKEDRNNLLEKVDELQQKNEILKQENLNAKADSDEFKIEISILRKRHIAEMENLKHTLAISEQKREILETKLRNLTQELGSYGKRSEIDDNKLRQKERELENQLELMAIDADSKVKSRDTKILELKRKIDSLEFNMENMSIREKQSRKDKLLLEEKLARVIDTLRSSLNVLEDEIEITDIESGLNI